MGLKKNYDAKEVEERWYASWVKDNLYKFDKDDVKKPIYSIDTPPPTVSGRLHMGHAFSGAQMDFIARYKRMKGFNVLHPFGTDDNGLPTQRLIEKEKKVKANEMDRDEFVKLCNDTLDKELRPKYLQDFKRLGISADWEIFYSTIDEHTRKVSQKSFLELYEMGRAYRKEAAVIWCPHCQTAISQVECEDKELSSSFNNIVFKVDDEELVVATTRPELLSACVSLFFHPKDKRYKHLKGKMAKVPLFDFEVPIIEEEKGVDMEKGTGLVMCCTFGDQTDVEWQKVHSLPIKSAILKDGTMSSLADKYEGLAIEEARKKIIKDLRDKKLLVNEKKISHTVNVHERCGTTIEFIHSKQWFIRYLDLKDDMLRWGNEFRWHPSYFKNRYENWVNGLSWDWCISRQISFGVAFPVWYCKECGEIVVEKEKNLPVDPTKDKPPVDDCPKCKCKEFIPEKDIINTWATSSLTPTIVKELLNGSPVYPLINDKPMDLRTQGHDIISFWLFNTVVKSKLHFNIPPWKDAFINGWILDPKGKKMSKSKGNTIEPIEMIDKYSADALRYMSGTCKLGQDLPFPEKELVSGQRTITKIFNASKFGFMHLEGFDNKKPKKLWLIDLWMLHKLNTTIKTATEMLEIFEFSKALQETTMLFWQDLCDNYLEIIKDRIYNPDKRGEDAKKAAQYTLFTTLKAVLKLFAPFMPFVTEELYTHFFKEKSVHLSDWPSVDDKLINKEICEKGDRVVEIISEVRKFKNFHQKSLREEVSLVLEEKDKDLEEFFDDLKATCNAREISFGDKFEVSF